MKPLRVVLAGLVGGIIVFAWGAVAHIALPIGEMGIKSLPAEETVVPVLKTAVPESGFYMFPGWTKNPTDAEKKALEEKYKTGPHGILVFHPTGEEMMTVRQLGTEFGSVVVSALIAAIILGAARAGMGCGAGLGLLMGVFGWVNLDVSYWNWYGFPCEMICGSLIEQSVGWLVAGGVMGLIIGKGKGPTAQGPVSG